MPALTRPSVIVSVRRFAARSTMLVSGANIRTFLNSVVTVAYVYGETMEMYGKRSLKPAMATSTVPFR